MRIIPSIFDSSKVIAAQSTRRGGVSISPFNSLNLGKSTDDLLENVIQNRKLFFNDLNVPLENISLSKQVHGSEILIVDKPVIAEGYDAMITNKPNCFLAVSIADCVPILIHDAKTNVVAAIHAGWRGTVENIVLKVLKKMQSQFNTQGNDCFVFIGACISFEAFEVGDEVADQFEDLVKKRMGSNKYHVNLKAANQIQLTAFGVPDQNIEISKHCTVKDNDLFFSHRHENGKTGRMMAVIGIKQ